MREPTLRSEFDQPYEANYDSEYSLSGTTNSSYFLGTAKTITVASPQDFEGLHNNTAEQHATLPIYGDKQDLDNSNTFFTKSHILHSCTFAIRHTARAAPKFTDTTALVILFR